MRLLKHLFTPDWAAHRAFPRRVLKTIKQAIHDSEQLHRGELRFAVQAGLPIFHLKQSPRAHAEETFSLLRVWDTEENTGVLIYVQLVDRRIEIVADRGISGKVPQSEWDAICRAMQTEFRAGRYEEGALAGIRRITDLLALHFPARRDHPNELPDQPVIL